MASSEKSRSCNRDFPHGPVDAGSIPGRGTKILWATGQLSPRATTTELKRLNYREARVPQTKDSACLSEDPMCRN